MANNSVHLKNGELSLYGFNCDYQMSTNEALLNREEGNNNYKSISKDIDGVHLVVHSEINYVHVSWRFPFTAIGRIAAYKHYHAIKTINWYKVMRVYRVSGRKKLIKANLLRNEAIELVNSFPDSKNSMVCFYDMN